MYNYINKGKEDESQYITRKILEVEDKIQSLERQKYQ